MRAQEQGGEVTAEHLGRLYVFSLMWSVGAVLEPDGRRRVEQWLRSREMLALDLPPLEGPDDSMFDYYVGSDGESWASIRPSHVGPFFFFFQMSTILPFSSLPAAAAAKSLQSCPTLCDPIGSSPLGASVPGILQARTLEWVAISFSNT